jgi:hypothetical protein
MWHAVLIALHAVSGTVALAAGLVAHRRLFGVYLWSLVATVVFLAAAVVEEWGRIPPVSRGLFAAFVVLGLVMVWLALAARRLPPGSPAYLDRVGFTLVALFDAFVVIAVLNLGAPVWLVVTSGVAVAVAGHLILRVAKSSARQPVG